MDLRSRANRGGEVGEYRVGWCCRHQVRHSALRRAHSRGLVKMLRAARPDVVALQEASKGRVPELAEALGGMHWTVRHNCAILSHHPLRGLEENQLSGRGKQADNGGRGGKGDRKGRHSVATVSPRDGTAIQICCLHLDHVREPTRPKL